MKKAAILAGLLMLNQLFVWAQINISGTIADENGETLIGATVMIKGTTTGTITDIDGQFSLAVPGEQAILVVSYVGYATREFPVGSQRVFNITLSSKLTSLDEVVVIGYGTVTKRDLTGSVASVSANQIKDIPVTNAAQAITGRLAGVQVTTAEGSPDAEVRIRVRGGGSITQDNSPLIIIDGFPADRISDIPPTDIESIDVLKDASSAAIYGARGANGVIIITTKSGKAGKVRVNYNTYYGIKRISKKLDLLDPYEYVLYQYERSQGSFLDRQSFQKWFGTYSELGDLYEGLEPIDWQEKVFGRYAPSIYHNLGINGGTDKSNYNLSLTRNNDEGIMIETGYTRNNANFRMENQASDRLKINLDLRYSDTKIWGAGTSDPGTSTSNNLRHTVIYRPLDLVIQATDISDEEYYEQSNLSDPVRLAEDTYQREYRKNGTYNAALTYNIIEGFDFRTDFGLDTRERRRDRFYGLSTYLARRYGDKPVVRVDNTSTQTMRWSNTLNYKKNKILDIHDINLMLGQEYVYTKGRQMENEVRSFPKNITPDIAIGTIELGEEYQRPYAHEYEVKLLSYFGRVNYGLMDKYLFSFTLRSDGSSKFAPGNRWGLFPSGSFAWRISEEEFMKQVDLISSLKARLSYGQAGNNRISDFLWTTTFGIDAYKGYYLNNIETSYLYPTSLANPDLVWETTIARNFGIDLGMLRNRYFFTMDIYYNTVKDLLIEQRIPDVAGYALQIQNIGQTSNYGIEFSLDAYIIEKKDIKLSSNFNIAFNRNRVENLGELDYFTVSSGWIQDTGDDYIVRVGDPLGLMYGFVTDGYYTVDDFTYNEATSTYTIKPGVANNAGLVFAGFGPGNYKFMDIASPVDDGSLVTFDNDRTVIGNANPKHIGGLNLMMNYKNFDRSLFLNWVYGNDIYNANKIEFTSGYRRYTNLLADMGSGRRWITIDDQGVVVTNPVQLAEINKNAETWKPPVGRYLFHSWAVEDGSFLRVNNLTLGYTIPSKLTKTVRIDNVRVYFTANNLHTFTRYSGYDPEVDTRRRTPMTPGVDYSAYPRSKSYIFGLNISL